MTAPCCTNTVTPKMIRKGEMKIGDRIHLDDVLVSAPEPEPEPVSGPEPEAEILPVHTLMPQGGQMQSTMPQGGMPQGGMPQTGMPQAGMQQATHPQAGMSQTSPHMQARVSTPITYGQMTPYMNQTQIHQRENEPMFTVPQTPMTTQEFQETIDSTDVQSYLGFMRTQIGRYMRLEQLMGSNNIEQRFGFLVGLGTNYVILQEITSGNIMVVDLFTIRLTYIYYSDPVVPPGVPF